MENVTVIIERNSDGTFTAIPQQNHKIGFIGMGKTVEATIADLQNSYEEAKAMLPSLPEMAFEYKFDTASFLHYINGRLNLADLQTITGINRHQLSHYANGLKKPRPQQRRRIVEGLHKIGRELIAVE